MLDREKELGEGKRFVSDLLSDLQLLSSCSQMDSSLFKQERRKIVQVRTVNNNILVYEYTEKTTTNIRVNIHYDCTRTFVAYSSVCSHTRIHLRIGSLTHPQGSETLPLAVPSFLLWLTVLLET